MKKSRFYTFVLSTFFTVMYLASGMVIEFAFAEQPIRNILNESLAFGGRGLVGIIVLIAIISFILSLLAYGYIQPQSYNLGGVIRASIMGILTGCLTYPVNEYLRATWAVDTPTAYVLYRFVHSIYGFLILTFTYWLTFKLPMKWTKHHQENRVNDSPTE